MARLELPEVTACAVTSVNVEATVDALRASMDQVQFAETLLFSHAAPSVDGHGIKLVPTDRLKSGADYSRFMLRELVDHIQTRYCLIIQWDGFVLDATRWDASFLDFDYIGAPWPQFHDGHDVGNGGFSLRSRKLLHACRDPEFAVSHPEDVAICRVNRDLLERKHCIRFADRAAAARFSLERSIPRRPTFGFHGIFNIIPALGEERFWSIYRQLDRKESAFADYWQLISQIRVGPRALSRVSRLTADRFKDSFRRGRR